MRYCNKEDTNTLTPKFVVKTKSHQGRSEQKQIVIANVRYIQVIVYHSLDLLFLCKDVP